MTGCITAELSVWEVCRNCWQRHLDIEAEERRATDEEVRRLTAAVRSWLNDAPTIDVSHPQVKKMIKLGLDELFDPNDLAGLLGKSAVFDKPPLTWMDKNAMYGAHYEDVLAKTTYDTYDPVGQKPNVYIGSVFRVDGRRICIRWTSEHFFTR